MPGKLCRSVGQAEVGSVRPPRHWRTKANAARRRGKRVRRRRTRMAKAVVEEVDAAALGRRGA
jgi:hypothetical protein